jgi:hypothetical protein
MKVVKTAFCAALPSKAPVACSRADGALGFVPFQDRVWQKRFYDFNVWTGSKTD